MVLSKTGGLLLRLIVEANICIFKDDLYFILHDRHNIKTSYLNNIIDNKHLSQIQISNLSNIWIRNAKK